MSTLRRRGTSKRRRGGLPGTVRVALAAVAVLAGAALPLGVDMAAPCTRGSSHCLSESSSVAKAPAVRDKYLWPFASTSIWNLPLGSGAVYRPLRLTPPTVAYGADAVYLSFSPTAPLRSLVDRGYWWPWRSGPLLSGRSTGVRVRVPDGWVIPPPPAGETPNRASAALEAGGTVAREWQYSVRPSPQSDISMFGGPRARFLLTGDGLQGSQPGAHGGSGMTAIGGTIRRGELTGPVPIRHALAVTMNMRKWGTKGGRITNGFRWPATSADAYWNGGAGRGYGTLTATGGSSRDGLGMGTLLAIPANVDLRTLHLETRAGAKLAWTQQNYGAYVVDDSLDPGDWDVHRLDVEAGVLRELPALDTYPGTNTPFGRDMNKIFVRLAVVDNNSPSSIGGGGTLRQPLAPPPR